MIWKIRSRWLRQIANGVATSMGMSPLAVPPLPRDGRILFFSRDREEFPFLSNFYAASFELDGCTWPHVELYYQAQKSTNPDYRNEIRKRESPRWAKFIGDSRIGDPQIAKRSWFRKHPEDLRDDWREIRIEVMRKALIAKFAQNSHLACFLLATHPARLVEDSEKDPFWGTGKNGEGANQLGKLLEEVRSNLARQ